jgi:hypothetical protein
MLFTYPQRLPGLLNEAVMCRRRMDFMSCDGDWLLKDGSASRLWFRNRPTLNKRLLVKSRSGVLYLVVA